MRFHNRKLFNGEYEPRPFCYAIRRPDHYPEGVLSIESDNNDGTPADPLYTVVRHGVATRPMRFALNAATNVSFFGDRFVHAFVGHKFSGQASPSLNIVARARQFSSFILLVGNIASAEVCGVSAERVLSCIHSFIRCFVRSFVHSLLPSFIPYSFTRLLPRSG
jgi:hypothetical protein